MTSAKFLSWLIGFIKKVKKLRKKLSRKERDLGLSPLMKQELANEILQMLRALEPHAYVTEQQGW